ncbi:7-carboxy-7-deazaguanine synthase QueE [Aetokthonos hydrillicola Thurmond2011]|jgi:organic radical activating enzyme|uniref:7-carboxy-7-deazaguanine synthase n=1 Tax=Aetokthonos hydrillicola Thurmond2011 TaxID=2712845 RepID=A0AAP5IDW6_9CYAN|nr:7-carboxy-7-deazaguanine synthase QueE [Aetokthonos hydrillicola]MBO3459541.1 7-carboxy-7-deazaguanine synthase QueE [Aetokthonos hydrillicola CCALA 1050]MBW4590290.1 7-carboxy-7-deazaguanine synthase QueE [Aetokthonos hydrillicola CCALA 1050]MDR9899422.1 7-carboxy-7-deazaguanine synthase QueE [Aetokthonos hydrillicola Thurmond2011]
MQVQIPIHETFQNTIQGEGYWTGILVDFIRLYGCPVSCPWCDTGYAEVNYQIPYVKRSISELLAELKSRRVVISGGEPFIQKNLPDLVQALLETGKDVSIETSGSFWQEISQQAWITLSPKQHINPKYRVKQEFWHRANELKIVISTGKELDFYQDFLSDNTNIPVFLQPEWNERSTTIPLTLKLLKQKPNYRISLQIHKLICVQ